MEVEIKKKPTFGSLKRMDGSRKLHLEKGHLIKVFTPKGFTIDDSDRKLQKIAKVTVRFHTKTKILRLAIVLIHGLILALLITYSYVDFHITKAIAVGLGCLFCVYFIQVYYLVMYSDIPHRVYSLSGIVPSWTKMPITYRALLYEYSPIQSISEFSAIGGGMSNQLLLIISTVSWVSVLTQTLNNIYFEKIWLQFTDDLVCTGCNRDRVNVLVQEGGFDEILILIGAFGLVMIGIFELDPFSPFMQNMHMLGVYLGFACPVGYSWQQIETYMELGFKGHGYGIISAVLIDVVAIVFAIVWMCYYNRKSEKLSEHYKENPPKTVNEHNEVTKKVRHYSIMNVFTESITLICGSSALCLWLWHFNDLSPSFKKAPGVLPTGGPWKFFFDYIITKYNCDSHVRPAVPNPAVSYCSNSPTMSPI